MDYSNYSDPTVQHAIAEHIRESIRAEKSSFEFEDFNAGIVRAEEVYDYGDEKEYIEPEEDDDWFDKVDYGDE